jgi:surfeit locus 1 family protein
MAPRTRGYLFFGISLVLALVFVRLGIWQLSRLDDRRTLNRAARAARALPPLNLDDPAALAGLAPEALDNRRVGLTGRYDHAAEIVLRAQSEGGVAGVRIVTPLRLLRGDTAVLVQRGFVPSPDAATVDLTGLHEAGVVTVTGIVRALPGGVSGEPRELNGQLSWRRVDLAALQQRLPYPLAPFLVLQSPDSALPRLPRRDQPPALDDGPHLSYAVQWFAFAVTAVVVGGIIGFRRREGGSKE